VFRVTGFLQKGWGGAGRVGWSCPVLSFPDARVYGIVPRQSSMLELFLCIGVCVDKVYEGASALVFDDERLKQTRNGRFAGKYTT